MIKNSLADQGFSGPSENFVASPRDSSGRCGLGVGRGNRGVVDQAHEPGQPGCLGAGSAPSTRKPAPARTSMDPRDYFGQNASPQGIQSDRVSGTPRTRNLSLREEPPEKDSESAPCAASEPSVFPRSILDFGEDRADVQARRSGLSLPDGMSFDSWRELGCRVALVANCSAWWLGDWLIYGEQAYGDRYKQAISDTSLSYQTLRNYAWVARTFPVSRRRDKLSFGHHVEVAALPDEDQDAWLARAEQLNWSCNRLRRALQAAKLANCRASGDEGTDQTRALKIDVPAERHDRWQSAAGQRSCSVADWIITTLDRAANEELSTGSQSRL
jgi:hypothetical protein